MGKRASWLACAVAGGLALVASAAPASAAIVIGAQETGVNGGAVTTVYSGGSGAFVGSYGTFSLNILTAITGIYPDLLGSTATNQVAAAAAGVLHIFVTETGLTSPQGLAGFLSSFTSNKLPAGWTVTETTFLNTANGLFGGTQLSSANFTQIGTQQLQQYLQTGGGPFSITEEFTITATGAGTSLSTIDVAAVPEPAAWALMLLGIAGVGAAMRASRSRKMAPALA